MTRKELEQCARKVVLRWFYAAVQDDKKSFVVRTLLNEEHTCDLDFSTTKVKIRVVGQKVHPSILGKSKLDTICV